MTLRVIVLLTIAVLALATWTASDAWLERQQLMQDVLITKADYSTCVVVNPAGPLKPSRNVIHGLNRPNIT